TANVSSAAGGGTPTGTVTFIANGVTLATANVTGGIATAKVPAMQVASAPNSRVEALYSGDAQFAGSSGSTAVNLVLTPNSAYVTISVSPNPVTQSGPGWPLFLTLTEKGGVNATLTRLSYNGTPLSLPGGFPSTSIPAKGSITARLSVGGFSPPVN